MMELPMKCHFVFTQILGLTAVILLVLGTVEKVNHTDAETLADPVESRFMWHPLLMSIGMCFLLGFSTVIFRVFSLKRKFLAKMIHTWVLAIAVGVSLVSLVFAIQARESWNEPHFGSLHGVFGLVTVILFVAQWVLSVPVYLWPVASMKIRTLSMPIHVALGISVFLCANVSMLTGFAEEWTTTTTSDNYYKASAFFHMFYTLAILRAVAVRRPKHVPSSK